MKGLIKFNRIETWDPLIGQKKDAIEVFRGKNRVATIKEYSRLERALNNSLEDVKHILNNFNAIMKRPPTNDELEFLKAIYEVKTRREERLVYIDREC